MILNLGHQPLISPLFYARNLNTVDLWQRSVEQPTSTFEEIKSLTTGGGREQSFWLREVVVYCFFDLIEKQPSSLNWQVFILGGAFFGRWLASAGDGRRCSRCEPYLAAAEIPSEGGHHHPLPPLLPPRAHSSAPWHPRPRHPPGTCKVVPPGLNGPS